MIFIADDEAAEVEQPADGSFDFPASLVAAEGAAVLSLRTAAILPMRADQLDAASRQSLAQRIAVGGAVVDQSLEAATEHATIEQRFDQRDLGWRGAGHDGSQRRAVSVDQEHDLGPLAAFGLPDAQTPFFAGANVPSARASSQSIRPIPSSRRSTRAQAFWNRPASVQAFNRRQQVLGDGKCFGKSFQRAPVRSIHRMPSRHGRGGICGRPPTRLGGSQGNKSAIRFHCSSVSCDFGSVMDAVRNRLSDGHHTNVSNIVRVSFHPDWYATRLPRCSLTSKF